MKGLIFVNNRWMEFNDQEHFGIGREGRGGIGVENRRIQEIDKVKLELHVPAVDLSQSHFPSSDSCSSQAFPGEPQIPPRPVYDLIKTFT